MIAGIKAGEHDGHIVDKINEFVESGLLTFDGGAFRLTTKGLRRASHGLGSWLRNGRFDDSPNDVELVFVDGATKETIVNAWYKSVVVSRYFWNRIGNKLMAGFSDEEFALVTGKRRRKSELPEWCKLLRYTLVTDLRDAQERRLG